MEALRKLRIGYVPYSPLLDRPGDRRRFCYYAGKRNLAFEIAKPSETYDVVVISEAADITQWSQYSRGKVIFDFVDSYLSIPNSDLKGRMRGLAKFVSGQHRHLRLNFRHALEDMCRRADAAICTTEEQRQRILPFCPKVHIILDAHGEVDGRAKQEYSSPAAFNLVWEGLGVNVGHLREIQPALQSFSKKRPVHLHVITELEYGQFLGGRFGQRSALDELRGLSPNIYFYAWNVRTFPAIVTSCDLALIPIPLHDPLCAGKPENRLLLFWRMGLPVLVSSTPAHVRVMKECDLSMALTSQTEWQEALEYYASSEGARRQAAQAGKAFVETHYSQEKMLERWDEVFRSIG